MGSNNITSEELRAILDEKLAPLKSDMAELREKRRETTLFLEEANTKYEEVISKFTQHEKERKEVIAENKILKSAVQTLEEHVKTLQNACNDMEQYSRRECLEIQGIPVTKPENTSEIVMKVGELIGMELKEDISVSHRLPRDKNYKGKRSEPAIIVKFVRRDIKEKFCKTRKDLKKFTTQDLGFPSKNNIYINESLTKRNKQLFSNSVKVKKELKYSYIWSSNGKIYLRKDQDSPAIPINSKDELIKLQVRAAGY